MVKRKSKIWIWIILALIVGGFVGASLFPKTIYKTNNQPSNSVNCPSIDTSCQTQLITSSIKGDCYEDVSYWTLNDLQNIKGNYCFFPYGDLQQCANYVNQILIRENANFRSCQNGAKSTNLDFSIF